MRSLYSSNDATAQCDLSQSAITLKVERECSRQAFEIVIPADAVFAETNICASACYYANGCFYSVNEGAYSHRLVYDLATNTLCANLGGRYFERDQWVISNLIRPFLQSFILPFHNVMSLHGAALAKGERTVFLSGSGGAGKSTTTLGLMRAGWSLLSDDGPFFTFSSGRACALSSLDYLHVTNNTLTLFPELAPHVIGPSDYREKFAVSRTELPNAVGPSSPRPITHFLRLDRRQVDRPEFVPRDRSAVLQTLLNEGMTIFRTLPRDSFSVARSAYSRFVLNIISDVSRTSNGYDLTFANHHLADLSSLIEGLPMPEAT